MNYALYERLLYDEALAHIYDVGLTSQDWFNVGLLTVMTCLSFGFLLIHLLRKKWDGVILGAIALAILGVVFTPRVVSKVRENRYAQYTDLVKHDQEALDKTTELYLAELAGDGEKKAEVLKWFRDPMNKRR